MPVSVLPFGTSEAGEPVLRFRLAVDVLEAELVGYGASLAALRAPDRHGRAADVVLGFETLADYAADQPHFGAVVGRFANRIARARFPLDGGVVRLSANHGPHHLHGGARGLGRQLWQGEPFEDEAGVGVCFRCTSPDGAEGYPGRLEATARYRLARGGLLSLELRATSDRRTLVNLTHHAYFHLGDGGVSPVLDHRVCVDAESVLEIDGDGIPTGRLVAVARTPLDLRAPVRLGDRIERVPGGRGGFDHCYVLSGARGRDGLRHAARVEEPRSGRTLDVLTDQPGLQLYTSNFLDGRLAGRGGIPYGRHHALCLEPQGFPDAPNHAEFPTTVLEAGAEYVHRSIFRFGTMPAAAGEDGGNEEEESRP
jgi:aldose 1-epimerase